MSHQPLRLPTGGRIDRGVEVPFFFDGRRHVGHPGDTLASALLANGVRLVGRSFKFHRPRGVYTAGVAEPFRKMVEPVLAQMCQGLRNDRHPAG